MSQSLSRSLLFVFLALSMVGVSFAGNNGKGKPGGDGGDPTANLPPVRYEFERIPVPGIFEVTKSNDFGSTIGSVRTAEGDSRQVLVELDGSIRYLDMVLDPDLYTRFSAYDINNFGQICGAAYTGEGVPRTALLLTPDGSGGYGVTEFPGFVDAWSVNELGHVVASFYDNDDPYFSVITPAEMLPLSWGLRLNSNERIVLNDADEALIFGWDFGSVKLDTDGGVLALQQLPGSVGLPVATDLNANGYMAGRQMFELGKRRNLVTVSRPVAYDVTGNAVELDLPGPNDISYGYLQLNDQNVNGAPVIAGSCWYDEEPLKTLWLKYPGYPTVFVDELMDEATRQTWGSIKFNSSGSSERIQLLTPRNGDGSVDDDGFPIMIGVDNPDYPGRGIFVLRPVALP